MHHAMTQRILVIEDEAQIAGYLRRGLTLEGYDVEVAGDGVDGLTATRERPPDLVVLDVMLPKLHGFAVAERLRAAFDVPIADTNDGRVAIGVASTTWGGFARIRDALAVWGYTLR